jgi:hypothetical protein
VEEVRWWWIDASLKASCIASHLTNEVATGGATRMSDGDDVHEARIKCRVIY